MKLLTSQREVISRPYFNQPLYLLICFSEGSIEHPKIAYKGLLFFNC
jgi:hypothetical protein